jgi:hypothetical protein
MEVMLFVQVFFLFFDFSVAPSSQGKVNFFLSHDLNDWFNNPNLTFTYLPCGPGYNSINFTSPCTPCPPGTFKPTEGFYKW